MSEERGQFWTPGTVPEVYPTALKFFVDRGMVFKQVQRYSTSEVWISLFRSITDGKTQSHKLVCQWDSTSGWRHRLYQRPESVCLGVYRERLETFKMAAALCELKIGDWTLIINESQIGRKETVAHVQVFQDEWSATEEHKVFFDETLWWMLAEMFFQEKDNTMVLVDYLQEMKDVEANRLGEGLYQALEKERNLEKSEK